ncbi:F-box protein, partial [Streptomyces erythrochromogenes]|uniref:F-box protein n=1 Tax=Streptomyces erythrochromogenes TaxID=285574 RepID=UPI003445ABC0
PVLQDADAVTQTTVYEALTTTPESLPRELWQQVMGLLPLEDLTRLAGTSWEMRQLVADLAPQGVDPEAHGERGFVRTIYTQTELDEAVNGGGLRFIPGTGSDLTVNHGDYYNCPRLYGPGTLTAVTGGYLTAHDDATITTVTGGTVWADDQATITEVTGGPVTARGDVTITTVTRGTVRAYDQATITEVTGGEVKAYGDARITTMIGGTVEAYDDATITTMTGGIAFAYNNATIITMAGGQVEAAGHSAVNVAAGSVNATQNATVNVTDGGNVTIVACDNAQVHIPDGTDAVVHAYDNAQITAGSGRIVIHSPNVNATNNGNATIVDNNVTDSGSCAIS